MSRCVSLDCWIMDSRISAIPSFQRSRMAAQFRIQGECIDPAQPAIWYFGHIRTRVCLVPFLVGPRWPLRCRIASISAGLADPTPLAGVPTQDGLRASALPLAYTAVSGAQLTDDAVEACRRTSTRMGRRRSALKYMQNAR